MIISLVQLVAVAAIVPAPCPYTVPATSCYAPGPRVIYIAPAHRRDADTLMHEYGHAWDFQRLSNDDRERAQRALGFPKSQGWWEERKYRLSPAETFANAYADCALGTWWRNRKVCALLPRPAFVMRKAPLA